MAGLQLGRGYDEHGDGLPPALGADLGPPLRDALGHPLRRQILRVLQRAGGVRSLSELAAAVGAGEVLVAYHVQVLEGCGLVRSDGSSCAFASAADGQVPAILKATRRTDTRLYK